MLTSSSLKPYAKELPMVSMNTLTAAGKGFARSTHRRNAEYVEAYKMVSPINSSKENAQVGIANIANTYMKAAKITNT